MKRLLALLLIVCVFCSGCMTLRPGTGMKISTDDIGMFSKNYSVDLINDQPDTTPKKFFRLNKANLNEWTQFLIDELTAELEKRGAVVSSDSPNKMNVKITRITSSESFAAIRMFLTVVFSAPDGSWSQTIEVNESSGWTAGRALGGVIYRANEKVLQDKRIMDKMLTN